jgi:hypothetical protein
MPTVRRIVRQAGADDYRFKSIVLGVVSSDAFRRKEAGDEAPLAEKKLAAVKSGAN